MLVTLVAWVGGRLSVPRGAGSGGGGAEDALQVHNPLFCMQGDGPRAELLL